MGEEEERGAHSRSAFLAFLAAAPSSCLSLPLLGALAPCHAVPAWQNSIPLEVPLGLGVTGDPSWASPTHPRLSQKQTNPNPGRRGWGGWSGGSQSRGEGFLPSVLPCGGPQLPPAPGRLWRVVRGRDGWLGEAEGSWFQSAVSGTVSSPLWDSVSPNWKACLRPQHGCTVVSPSSNRPFAEPLALTESRNPGPLCTRPGPGRL